MSRWLVMASAGLVATLLLAAGTVCLSSGCSSLGYYAHTASGHVGLMRSARPVEQWLDDAATPPVLRDRLLLAQRVRDYAVRELRLPDNASYRRYAELDRPFALWNVVAAPELDLTLKTWCFPIAGCVGYRGYYERARADALAAELRAEGYEASVYGVPAYSTLGLLDWIGGDPLLSSFIGYPEGELARLIFHELAHQVAYAGGDTMFNESFATAVERIGGQRWLEARASEDARRDYARYGARRADFRAFTGRYRAELEALYKGSLPDADKRIRKAEIMARMRADYAVLKAERWNGYAGYDGWFERANNAALGVLTAYNELVPDFERLFEREGRDFERFYAEVRRLAALPRDERRATLQRP